MTLVSKGANFHFHGYGRKGIYSDFPVPNVTFFDPKVFFSLGLEKNGLSGYMMVQAKWRALSLSTKRNRFSAVFFLRT